jgi:hypothetical protein
MRIGAATPAGVARVHQTARGRGNPRGLTPHAAIERWRKASSASRNLNIKSAATH